MFRKLFISLLLLLASNMPLLAKCLQSLYSPDRNIQLVINQEQEHIMATVKYQGRTIIPEIRFGIQEQKQTFYGNMKCLGFSKETAIREQYSAIHGKKSSCGNIGNAARFITFYK